MHKPTLPPSSGAQLFDIQTGLSADSHHTAITKAIDWLVDRHRKGFRNALDEWMDAVMPDATSLPEADLDEDASEALTTNATEWLLARGEIFAKGGKRPINAYLLGRDGPWFSPAQQRWIAQLAERPLRLWRVTEVIKDVGLTLVDAIDIHAEPVSVQERAGSQDAQVGMLLGARVMVMGEHFQLSGATYPFARLNEAHVLAEVGAALAGDRSAESPGELAEWAIARHWLAQFFEPAEMPQLVDAATGDPMLLITDHYRVADAVLLAQRLAMHADVEGDGHEGWRRVQRLDEESTRILLSINLGRTAERLEVFARTQALADAGRDWFQTLAGSAVVHLTREITDPRSPAALAGGGDAVGVASAPSNAGLSPEQTTAMLQRFMQRHYAKWADEPVPMLDHNTPRQCIGSAAGLERVKGLIRLYESGEAEMAAREGRAPVSYQFLWDSLGITR